MIYFQVTVRPYRANPNPPVYRYDIHTNMYAGEEASWTSWQAGVLTATSQCLRPSRSQVRREAIKPTVTASWRLQNRQTGSLSSQNALVPPWSNSIVWIVLLPQFCRSPPHKAAANRSFNHGEFSISFF